LFKEVTDDVKLIHGFAMLYSQAFICHKLWLFSYKWKFFLVLILNPKDHFIQE